MAEGVEILERLLADELRTFPRKDREKLRKIFEDVGISAGDAILLLRSLREAGFLNPTKHLEAIGKELAGSTESSKPEGWVPPEWEGR